MQKDLFFNIDDPKGGISRELAPGINTTIYTGDQAMISVVRFDPNSRGKMHEHTEEQWGYCVSGSGEALISIFGCGETSHRIALAD